MNPNPVARAVQCRLTISLSGTGVPYHRSTRSGQSSISHTVRVRYRLRSCAEQPPSSGTVEHELHYHYHHYRVIRGHKQPRPAVAPRHAQPKICKHPSAVPKRSLASCPQIAATTATKSLGISSLVLSSASWLTAVKNPMRRNSSGISVVCHSPSSVCPHDVRCFFLLLPPPSSSRPTGALLFSFPLCADWPPWL